MGGHGDIKSEVDGKVIVFVDGCFGSFHSHGNIDKKVRCIWCALVVVVFGNFGSSGVQKTRKVALVNFW